MGEIVYENKIKEKLSNFIGKIFEDMCIQYLKRMNAKLELPFIFDQIGRWWGNNPKLKTQEEIDIIAYSKNQAIFGECKWRNEKADINVLEELKRKADLYHLISVTFTISNFTPSFT